MPEGSTKELRRAAIERLRARGYEVRSLIGPGRPEGALLELRKDGKLWTCSVRSSRDRWFAYTWDEEQERWQTLDDADYVAIAALDVDVTAPPGRAPTRIEVYLVTSANVREFLNMAFEARRKAGHAIRDNIVWICIDKRESGVLSLGSGVAEKALWRDMIDVATKQVQASPSEGYAKDVTQSQMSEAPLKLTIREAKQAVAAMYDVSADNVEIVIRG